MKHKVKRINFVIPIERSSLRCHVGRSCGNTDEKASA
jgi:hypothetical protein